MDLFHLYPSVVLKQTFAMATFITKQYVMATFILILLSLFWESYYVCCWYFLKPAWGLSTLTREQHYSTRTLASLLAYDYGTLNFVVRDTYKHGIFL